MLADGEVEPDGEGEIEESLDDKIAGDGGSCNDSEVDPNFAGIILVWIICVHDQCYLLGGGGMCGGGEVHRFCPIFTFG